MDYRFNTVVDRRNTDSLKYDSAARRGRPADVLPLWVADMDFPAPPEVLGALHARVDHGIFGYSEAAGSDYFDALSGWYDTRFGWTLSPEWIVMVSGVVHGLCACIRALTDEGDAVLIQPPVYYPFSDSILANKRRLVENELLYVEGRYVIGLEDFERKIVENNVKLFVLCSPHNPVGRVWTREELVAMGDVCVRHGVLVVSDEIHADFVYPGGRHHVFAALKPEFADISVTCTAPSKTFNLAGLQLANLLIPNAELRRRIRAEINASGYSHPNVMGLVACRAAYARCAGWVDALIAYLAENLRFTREFLAQKLPAIRLVEPEGTYLVWLDCRDLGLPDDALDQWITRRAKLWLDAGTMFGAGGEGFQRVNIACPRATLERALTQLKAAFDEGLPGR